MSGWEPPSFTLRQLQYALAVDQTRGFRKAAEACHVSQPSLSVQLAALEDVLGVTLFERQHKGALRTPAAHDLLDRARSVLAAARELEAAARWLAQPLTGSVDVGIIPTVAPYLLPRSRKALRRHCPELEILWREDKTESLIEDLAAGRLDAALVALEADLGEVEQAVIAKDPFVVAAAAGHPVTRRKGRLRDLSSLGEHPVYLLDEGHCFGDQALSLCARVGVREADFRATSLATLVQVVASSGGLTLLPELAVDVENRHDDLAIVQFQRAPCRTLAVVWRPGSPIAATAQALATAMKDAFVR